MDTLYTFWDDVTHYKTESVHFLGLMNSATKKPVRHGLSFRMWGDVEFATYLQKGKYADYFDVPWLSPSVSTAP